MGRAKMVKIAEFNEWPNCVNQDESKKGNWNKHFGNDNPIVLEVGCGKGDLSVGLASQIRDKNFIGTDIKGPRMWTGAKRATEEGVENVAFLRTDVRELELYFAPGEVSEIWVTFPDPFPRKKHMKNRLVFIRFLEIYQRIIKKGGPVFFKTDNDGLFEWALEHFSEINADPDAPFRIVEDAMTRDLHHSDLLNNENGVITDYERRFMELGEKINYIAFHFG